jgi:hypothetical protein
MDETTREVQEPTAPKKGLPAWAWSVIGVVIGAALFGGAWLLYESGRSAGRIEGFGPASIETTFAETAEIATESVEPTSVAPATDGSTLSAGGASGSSSSGSSSGGSTGGISSGSSSGSSGSGSSPGLPAPPTPITPSNPALKQKIPVSIWKTVSTLSSTDPHGVYNWSTGTAPSHVRVIVNFTYGNGGNAVVVLRKTSGTPVSDPIWSTSNVTTGLSYTSPSIDLPPNVSWRIGASTPDQSNWTIKIQTRN